MLRSDQQLSVSVSVEMSRCLHRDIPLLQHNFLPASVPDKCQGMFVVKYHARFITVERFAPGNFASKRELTAQFVSGLHIRIRSMLANLHVQNWSRQYEGVGISVCPWFSLPIKGHRSVLPSRTGAQRPSPPRSTIVEVEGRRWSEGIWCWGSASAEVPWPDIVIQGLRPMWWRLFEVPNMSTVPEATSGSKLGVIGAFFLFGEMGHRAAECLRQPCQQQHQQQHQQYQPQ